MFDPKETGVTLALDDSESAIQTGIKESWRTWLQLSNLLGLRPTGTEVTVRSLVTGASAPAVRSTVDAGDGAPLDRAWMELIAQATDEDRRADFAGEVDDQVVERARFDRDAGVRRQRPGDIRDQLQPGRRRQHRRLGRMHADADHEALAEPERRRERLDMPVGQGIEAAGIERDAGHRPPLAASAGERNARFEPV